MNALFLHKKIAQHAHINGNTAHCKSAMRSIYYVGTWNNWYFTSNILKGSNSQQLFHMSCIFISCNINLLRYVTKVNNNTRKETTISSRHNIIANTKIHFMLYHNICLIHLFNNYYCCFYCVLSISVEPWLDLHCTARMYFTRIEAFASYPAVMLTIICTFLIFFICRSN